MVASRPIRTAKELLAKQLIEEEQLATISDVAKRYAVSITPAMHGLITDLDDPVARQFVPSSAELVTTPEEREDPIGDDPFTPVPGVTHRYPDRVLLKPVLVCPVYCRFCFRREVVGPGDSMLKEDQLKAALDYIRARPEIWEVIFTGGDPLIMSPHRLRPILRELDAIDHVKVIRFHTRVPVVDPDRVTPELVEALTLDTPVWVVVHTNHSQEIGEGARRALRLLVAPVSRWSARRCCSRGSTTPRGAGGPVPHPDREPGQALLPAPRGPGRGHQPLPHHHRGGAGAHAPAARAGVGHVPAHLRAGHPGRPRQGAHRPPLPGRGRYVGHRSVGRRARLPAPDARGLTTDTGVTGPYGKPDIP